MLIQFVGSDPNEGYIILSNSLTSVHVSDLSFADFDNTVFNNQCDSLFISNCNAFNKFFNVVDKLLLYVICCVMICCDDDNCSRNESISEQLFGLQKIHIHIYIYVCICIIRRYIQ